MLFYQVRLYAEVALQGFFVLASMIGWWYWLHGDRGGPQPIRRSSSATVAWAILGGIAATIAYGAILLHWTEAYAPMIDSSVLVFSVVAQLMLMLAARRDLVFLDSRQHRRRPSLRQPTCT